ncbi:PD-(D/E)XK nuclease family protein [Agaribacterium haliotis]|uniref:PD-(D/E)XK nuclease family protein n=1 Tax=Agaribacterium haliotis TaxID=2013869 RepID=UPI001303FA2B|nr:PD-(D/E)XK nuclease family protein [Agaribacterium haliotis]
MISNNSIKRIDSQEFEALLTSASVENHADQNAIPAQRLVVLCANNRQARFLKHKQCLKQQHSSVAVHAFDSWLEQLWLNAQQSQPERYRQTLIPAQYSSAIWATLVDQHQSQLPALVNRPGLAAALEKSWRLLRTYALDVTSSSADEAYASHQEYHLLLHLGELYQQRLDDLDCVDKQQAANLLAKYPLESEQRPLALLYGFADLSPLQVALLNAYFDEYRMVNLPDLNKYCVVQRCSSDGDELERAASWAKQRVQAHPGANIAIVVPDLHTRKTQISTEFDRYFNCSAYLHSDVDQHSDFFDISASTALGEHKLVADMVELISLGSRSIDKQQLATLLQSGYWGQSYNAARAVLMRWLNQSNTPECQLGDLLEQLHRASARALATGDKPDHAELHSDSSAETIQRYRQSIDELESQLLCMANFSRQRHSQTLSSWLELMLKQLSALGWPGARALGSSDYQILQALLKQLKAMQRCDAIRAIPLSFTQFLSQLKLWLAQSPLQIEVKHPRVRVLGLMEAVGLEFDYCRVLGVSDSALPQSVAPDPFIPLELQKQMHMPRASAERELSYARELLSGLRQCSEQLVFSYADQIDGNAQQASPLLNELVSDAALDANDIGDETGQSSRMHSPINSWVQQAASLRRFDSVATGLAPPLKPGAALPGGSSLLALQWTNPLYSFFRYGLNIDVEQIAELGFSPAQRGSALHNALAQIFKHKSDNIAIASWRQQASYRDELNELVQLSVDAEKHPARPLAELLVHFEVNYLSCAIDHFLQAELERKQAFCVEATEACYELMILGHRLRLRLDRLDEVQGQALILDYKTGKTSLSAALKKDISDFQLALYSMCLADKKLAGLAYITIKEQQSSYNGIVDEQSDIDISGVKSLAKQRLPHCSSWPEQLAHWRDCVERTASEYIHGKADYHLRNPSQLRFYRDYELAVREEERR